MQLMALGLLVSTPAQADNWTRFRGNDGTGIARGTGYPVDWSADKNIAWKTKLPGKGVSSPVVWDDRVFVSACSGFREDRLHVLCLNFKTGEKLWERTLNATGSTVCHPDTDMAAPTPTVDAEGVYALFATGDLVSFDHQGNLRWYRALSQDYPNITNQVGAASSPLLWQNRLMIPMDNSGDSFIAGLDTDTGENVWKVTRPKDVNWVTPLLREDGEQAQLLYQHDGALVAYNPQDGMRLWDVALEGVGSIPSAVLGNDRIYVVAEGIVALESSERGTEPKTAWRAGRLRPGMASPLAYQDAIYVVNRSGVLTAADADSGKQLWSERTPGSVEASPVAADGKIYVFTKSGKTAVFKAGSEPDLLAINSLVEEVEISATPAFVDGKILLRTDDYLYCIGK